MAPPNLVLSGVPPSRFIRTPCLPSIHIRPQFISASGNKIEMEEPFTKNLVDLNFGGSFRIVVSYVAKRIVAGRVVNDALPESFFAASGISALLGDELQKHFKTLNLECNLVTSAQYLIIDVKGEPALSHKPAAHFRLLDLETTVFMDPLEKIPPSGPRVPTQWANAVYKAIQDLIPRLACAAPVVFERTIRLENPWFKHIFGAIQDVLLRTEDLGCKRSLAKYLQVLANSCTCSKDMTAVLLLQDIAQKAQKRLEQRQQEVWQEYRILIPIPVLDERRAFICEMDMRLRLLLQHRASRKRREKARGNKATNDDNFDSDEEDLVAAQEHEAEEELIAELAQKEVVYPPDEKEEDEDALEEEDTDAEKRKRNSALRKIEKATMNILRAVAEGTPIEFKLNNDQNHSKVHKVYDINEGSVIAGSALRLARFLFCASTFHGLIIKAIWISRRGFIYIVLIVLIRGTVDIWIERVCFTFGIKSNLFVRSVSRGSVAGCGLRISLSNANAQSDNKTFVSLEGETGLPQITDVVEVDLDSDVRFVVVLEKKSILTAILQVLGKLKESLGGGLWMTGSGMPDKHIRGILALIRAKYPNLPFFIIRDCDYGGIRIARMYSRAVNDIVDLGVHASDLERHIPSLRLLPAKVYDLRMSEKSLQDKESLYPTIRDTLEFIVRRRKTAHCDSIGDWESYLVEKLSPLLLVETPSGGA
ncbi:DNA topoisomerase 6 subunit A [Mycena kentingensis (nom. inval.)]|nr:DNA topoisomerase 6 subunit A [Mycena kentingensis (nom. inval.)]